MRTVVRRLESLFMPVVCVVKSAMVSDGDAWCDRDRSTVLLYW